jgi:hypothetical protein
LHARHGGLENEEAPLLVTVYSEQYPEGRQKKRKRKPLRRRDRKVLSAIKKDLRNTIEAAYRMSRPLLVHGKLIVEHPSYVITSTL